ncbi:MAG: DUF4388 domain-containing protein [Proteobacteria bacterium]|nr:DUF4388 domain-containing protein [Pseudomonadota bacterium]
MNRLVLIADGNADRGRRLAAACQAARIQCKTAPHGAAALELALAERPALVVAQLDLPLVDALKLAEILRANPRTRSARFLFLGDDADLGQRGSVGDVLLPSVQNPDDILPTLKELMERQDRIELLDAEAESAGEAAGELAQLALAELLQLFHISRRSGRLELRARGDDGGELRGSILIRDGEVIQAQTGSVEGPKALFRLLAWRRGRFAFESGRSDEPPKILTPTRALLVEGLRQLREWERLAAQLPSLDTYAKLKVKTGELPNIVHPLTQEVLLLLELYPRVRDVVDRCSFPDYQVLRTLHTLSQRGIVELGGAAGRRIGPSTETVGLFDEAQSRRLRTWLRDGLPGERGPARGKLLIVAAEPEATPDFVNLLRQIPGIELAPGVATEKSWPGELALLGQIRLDETSRIDLIHVPASDRFAPLWPLAGYGALGTLFLLSGSIGEAAEKVRPVSDALRNLPRARIFHLVMLAKGERISPDELRENLSLIDEASLFLLPLDSGKEPAALLRNLFARVVP